MQVKSYVISSSDQRFNQVVVAILADTTLAISGLNGTLLYREPIEMATDDEFVDFLAMSADE